MLIPGVTGLPETTSKQKTEMNRDQWLQLRASALLLMCRPQLKSGNTEHTISCKVLLSCRSQLKNDCSGLQTSRRCRTHSADLNINDLDCEFTFATWVYELISSAISMDYMQLQEMLVLIN